MIAHPLKELRDMSDVDLVTTHDNQAKTTEIGLNYYINELVRREQEKQTVEMLNYTKSIKHMTVVMTIATIINVFIVIYSLIYR